jgi:hypothetical protein
MVLSAQESLGAHMEKKKQTPPPEDPFFSSTLKSKPLFFEEIFKKHMRFKIILRHILFAK